jgi:hypothetical protein
VKTCGGSWGTAPSFFISALHGCEGPPVPARLSERPTNIKKVTVAVQACEFVPKRIMGTTHNVIQKMKRPGTKQKVLPVSAPLSNLDLHALSLVRNKNANHCTATWEIPRQLDRVWSVSYRPLSCVQTDRFQRSSVGISLCNVQTSSMVHRPSLQRVSGDSAAEVASG